MYINGYFPNGKMTAVHTKPLFVPSFFYFDGPDMDKAPRIHILYSVHHRHLTYKYLTATMHSALCTLHSALCVVHDSICIPAGRQGVSFFLGRIFPPTRENTMISLADILQHPSSNPPFVCLVLSFSFLLHIPCCLSEEVFVAKSEHNVMRSGALRRRS